MDRHIPSGNWVQASLPEEVTGIAYQKSEATKFARAAELAEKFGLHYGIELVANPKYLHDQNAIKVYGVCDEKGWWSTKSKRYFLGFVRRQTAEIVNSQLISQGICVAGKLYDIKIGNQGYLAIRFFVLAPPGNSHSTLSKRAGH